MSNAETDSHHPDGANPNGASHGIPVHLFGKPDLLLNESEEDYLELRRAFFDDLKPRGILECLLLDDVVRATQETRRLKIWRNELISSAMVEAGAEILAERSRYLLDTDEAIDKIESEHWQAQLLKALIKDESAVAVVRTGLEELGLTSASLYAAAYELKLNEVERIGQALDRAERSRQANLKEFQLARAAKAAHARRRSDAAVEDLPDNVVVSV